MINYHSSMELFAGRGKVTDLRAPNAENVARKAGRERAVTGLEEAKTREEEA